MIGVAGPNWLGTLLFIVFTCLFWIQYFYYIFVYLRFDKFEESNIRIKLDSNKVVSYIDRSNIYLTCFSSVYGSLLENKSAKALLKSKARKEDEIDVRASIRCYLIERGRFTILPLLPISIATYLSYWFVVDHLKYL